MTEPTEAEVRAWLEGALATIARDIEERREGHIRIGGVDGILATHEQRAALYRTTLALLDEARKDRARLDWLEARQWIGIGLRIDDKGHKYMHLTYFRDDRRGEQYVQGPESLRAAIDYARGV